MRLIISNLSFRIRPVGSALVRVVVGLLLLAAPVVLLYAQTPVLVSPAQFRIGERLSYSVSFERYRDIAFAETYVVSRGKLGEADAIELRSRIKTLELLSAAFYTVDETRTTYASAETGNPLFVRRSNNSGVQSIESVNSYLTSPALGFDLLTLIYKVRATGGSGSFILAENDRTYPVTIQISGSERVRTGAGEYDTTVSTVQSEYLTDLGIQALRVYISNDADHLPVMFRFRTTKGNFTAALSGLQMIVPEVAPRTEPAAAPTPRPTVTPRPIPTPALYVPNQPLGGELGFELGERLEYRVSTAGRMLASVVFQAKERKQFMGEDSLLLEALATAAEPGNGMFAPGDRVAVQVNPETLAPRQIEMRFGSGLSGLTQTVQLDQRTGSVSVGANRTDVPVGTHSMLSLLYALRSFNLRPSGDLSNPVNDIRVAVFWDSKAHTFSLRPSIPETFTLNGEKVLAQQVAVNTGIPQLDMLSLRVWLSNDNRRVPLRISIGPYQADLVGRSIVRP